MHKDPARIQRMFGAISPWYDAVNHFGSAGQDLIWRKRLIANVMLRRDGRPLARALDLCCGTGDVTFLLARHANADALRQAGSAAAMSVPQAFPVPEMPLAISDNESLPEIIGLDFTPALLAIAKRRAAAFARTHTVAPRFLRGDALRVPFPDASFDAVTIAFGLRNLEDFEGGLREMARLLRPGGVLGILEFGHVPNPVIRNLYHIYFCHAMPAAGRLLTRTNAYAYLRDSCLAFPRRQDVASAIHWTGLRRCDVRPLTFGIADIYTAVKE